jgi:hypothetical protein
MKTQDIRNMGLAYVQVLEESKKKLDPVGKADADIDNDGDTDKSDDYLHNRRKSISSAIKGKGTKETVTTEALVGNQHKIDANKNGKIDSHDFKLLRKGKKVAEEAAWPIFARIQEKVNQTKGATPPESMEDRFTASDKKMVDGHGGIGKKTPEDFVNDDAIDKNPNMFNAANVKASPKRPNDQTIGDKTMPKAK